MIDQDVWLQTGGALLKWRADLTPRRRRAYWDMFYVSGLTRSIEMLGSFRSAIETLWLADERIVIKQGVYKIDDAAFEELAELAGKEPEAYDLILKICSNRLRANSKLSSAQRRVAADALQGKFTRPKPVGRPRSNNWNRDILIYKGVSDALRIGFKKEKAEGSQSDCAFSLVEEAFKNAGNHLVNYDTVRNVYRNADSSGLKKEFQKISSRN
ncbi:hypothetical protein [Celeribacter litoreus]|uniref:hypothetical protein n=1 Tax=Celeribacter litoreus TaxID=2876714 RepID=UPI001CD03729|nr:hypothetical protein [Celeribacter litoreus]MCA0044672.1 hypothetical protein [Celeribacter litoreus]